MELELGKAYRIVAKSPLDWILVFDLTVFQTNRCKFTFLIENEVLSHNVVVLQKAELFDPVGL